MSFVVQNLKTHRFHMFFGTEPLQIQRVLFVQLPAAGSFVLQGGAGDRGRLQKALIQKGEGLTRVDPNYPGKRPQTVLRCFLVGNRGCQVRVRICASESCSATSARCLCQDFCISSL